MNQEDNLENDFCIHEFKEWMDKNASESFSLGKNRKKIGIKVESRISERRLIDIMESEGDDVVKMAREFKKFGGIIKDSDENLYMIEVKSGNFMIPRNYVKKNED